MWVVGRAYYNAHVISGVQALTGLGGGGQTFPRKGAKYNMWVIINIERNEAKMLVYMN